MLTESQIQKNWDELLGLISQYAEEGNRWDKLLDFYNKNENRIGLMPASGKEMYHSAFPGGYVAHVLNVYNSAFKLKELWADMGATIDFTDEELAFSAINHDLGKMGTEDEDHYITQDDQWRRKNLGEIYKNNPAVPFMKDYDRSLFLLQSIGVEVTENEWFGIRLHAGLFDEENKHYWISFSPEYKLRCNLPYILHQADLMSARVESQNGVTKKQTTKTVIKESFKDIPASVEKPKVVKKTSPLGKFL